jgi:hypothetical protein
VAELMAANTSVHFDNKHGLKIEGGGLDAELGVHYTYDVGLLRIIERGSYIISMEAGVDQTTDRIAVAPSAADAEITLNGVNINAGVIESAGIAIERGAKAVLILQDGTDNAVKGGVRQAGIAVPPDAALTIKGTGALNATGGAGTAAIGGGYLAGAGVINIEGGNITAWGSSGTIPGNDMMYFGGFGIGGNAGGTVNITGGTVNATGALGYEGIGGTGGTVRISGADTSVTARSVAGAGIGGRNTNITILGGASVTAEGSGDSAGIGGDGATVLIYGAKNVSAQLRGRADGHIKGAHVFAAAGNLTLIRRRRRRRGGYSYSVLK